MIINVLEKIHLVQIHNLLILLYQCINIFYYANALFIYQFLMDNESIFKCNMKQTKKQATLISCIKHVLYDNVVKNAFNSYTFGIN